MAFMKALIPAKLLDSGPRTEGTESWPSRELTQPAYGTRPYEGRRPNTPLNPAGIRIELEMHVHMKNDSLTADQKEVKYPPISDPTPIANISVLRSIGKDT